MGPDEFVESTARNLLALWGTGRQTTEISVPDMPSASRVTARVRSLRETRGEKVRGRKIGFSNTAIWPRYGVDRPMWNYVWDTTLVEAPDGQARLDLAGMPEPRIEPEIVLELVTAPEPGMDERGLLACVGRVSHGFEIVQSVFPGWQFDAPGSAAAFGLHGALIVGPWHDVGPDRDFWAARLSNFTVALKQDGVTRDTGHARNVLGGPLAALRHLVAALADDPHAPPLTPGEVVTTGTLTDAHPVVNGSRWSTSLDGIPLAGLAIRFG